MIWHLIDSRTIGGAERHIAILLLCLRRRNIAAEAVLYRGYGNNQWLSQLSADSLPFRVLGGSPRSLIQALVQKKPKLLHVHGYKAGILGRLPAEPAPKEAEHDVAVLHVEALERRNGGHCFHHPL